MIFDRLEKQFYDLIAAFEAEEITYSEFEYEFAAFGDNTAIAVGEELFTFWANIPGDYLQQRKNELI
ncbi:MAG: hypothetical protein ACRCVH_12945 [Vagococcus fluvialis]|uniref:Uncharacterized protein n=1 Tax=Vagococcus fluvialis bH819 TaxID=1255619 RepID=A0A1X6WS02_9ENTE|nr:hypothetical protein [Vagococcus fluvialis]SLM87029.1 hypothetical protein FM121_13105 [Vagococcus fluvialis bH819]